MRNDDNSWLLAFLPSCHAAIIGQTRGSAPTLAAICCAAPFLYICYLVNKYAVDVPFWDDWAHVPMIRHFLDGNLQWSELWAQHNEHRLLIFRIARLFFVWASHWNLVYEMYS
ncbi:MAG: hypothetical protein ACLQT6_09730 [Desulfomonilaceae bacterium]